VTAIAALLAAVASTAGVIYQIWPEHHFRAGMVVREINTNVSRTEYLRDVGADLPKDQRDRKGIEFRLRALVEGIERSKLTLRSYVYAKSSNKAVSHWVEKKGRIFRSGVPISFQIARAWVPYPKSAGTYFGRLELYAGEALIAYADSRSFTLKGHS
jgi:hypothetical protein